MNKYFVIIVPTLLIMLMHLKPFDIVFRTFNTLFHELSHALVALIFGQKVKEIRLNRDFSGSCITKIKSKFSGFFISIAGYTLTSVLGYAIILCLKPSMPATFFYVFLVICVLALILYIRGSFGVVWTLLFIGTNFIFILMPIFRPYYMCILYTYACILLVENLLSTLTLLYITLTKPKKSSDAQNLQKSTHIPALIWSVGFLALAILIFYKSILHISTII